MDCPPPTRLQSLRESAMPREERDALTKHAESCEACRMAIAGLFANISTVSEELAPTELPGAPTVGTALGPGTKLDRYVVEGRLGAGAMGVVYIAHDPELDRRVAIKLLHARRGGEALRMRLQREAQALARISHPNVVAVHDVGTHGDDIFIAMELVRGETMRAWLARGQPLDATVARVIEAGRGLAAAHAADLIHRDFKPDNVLVGDDGRARVTDFGLARLHDSDDPPGSEPQVGSPLAVEMTTTGTLLGTPVYAAPEQLAGERVDARADQFGFCATAYEALYGVRPFAGATIDELARSIETQDLAAPKSTHKVPPRIHRALARGLAADPAARFPSMDALLAELAPPPKRVSWLVPVLGVAGVGCVVAIALAMRSGDNSACDARNELAGVWPVDGVANKLLDDHATEWIAVRNAVCREEARGAADLAPKLACLDSTKSQLRAFAKLVRDAKLESAQVTMLSSRYLAPAGACQHARGDTPALPHAQIADRVIELRQQVEDMRVAQAFGKLVETGAAIATMQEAAEELGYAPLTAEIIAVAAAQELALGNIDRGIELLRNALALAETHAHDRLKADTAPQLVRVLLQRGRLDEAIPIADLADSAMARVGETPRLALLNGANRARIAGLRGNIEEAVRLYQALITKLGNVPELATSVAQVRLDLQPLLIRLGRHDESAAVLRDAMRVIREHYGTVPGSQLSEECDAATLAGNATRAEELCRQYVAAIETSQGDSKDLARALFDHAVTLQFVERWADAREQNARAAKLFETAGDFAGAAFALEAAGRDALEVGTPDVALAHLDASLALATKAGDRDQLAFTRVVRGRALATLRRHADAIRELDDVIPLLEAMSPAPLNVIAAGRLALADALWQRSATGDRDRARAQATAAKEDAAKFRDKLPDAKGPNKTLHARMATLIAKIDAWLARH